MNHGCCLCVVGSFLLGSSGIVVLGLVRLEVGVDGSEK